MSNEAKQMNPADRECVKCGHIWTPAKIWTVSLLPPCPACETKPSLSEDGKRGKVDQVPDAEKVMAEDGIANEEDLFLCSFTDSGEHAASPMGDCIFCASKGRPHAIRPIKPAVADGPAEGIATSYEKSWIVTAKVSHREDLTLIEEELKEKESIEEYGYILTVNPVEPAEGIATRPKCLSCGHDAHSGERCRTAISVLPMRQCTCMHSVSNGPAEGYQHPNLLQTMTQIMHDVIIPVEPAAPVQPKKYLEWAKAGGPNECEHGYAAGISCPRCDEASQPAAPVQPIDELSMPLSQFMAGWQVYKAVDIEPYCESLRKELFSLRAKRMQGQGNSEEEAALKGIARYQEKLEENKEVLVVLDAVIEQMDAIARRTFPHLGISDARYESCFKAIMLRNKLKSTASQPTPVVVPVTYSGIREEFSIYKKACHARGIGGKDLDVWLTEQLIESRNSLTAQPAPLPSDDAPCSLCGEDTDHWAGNPGKWPVELPYRGGNGKTRIYHRSCVTEAIDKMQNTAALPSDQKETPHDIWDRAQWHGYYCKSPDGFKTYTPRINAAKGGTN